MNDSSAATELQLVLDSIRSHLLKAQELMDSVNPDSVFGARLQQLLDEMDDQTVRDLHRARASDAID